MTLLALLAIPSFVAFCFLAIIHTFQTMSLRLAENAPFPTEALLHEYLPAYFPAKPAFRTALAGAARLRTYERLLENCTPRSGRVAFSRESNLYMFPRLSVPASFSPEYRRNRLDSSFRMKANADARYKPFDARANFPRQRTRLSALTRRPRSLSTALMSCA